jgi:hypothetical protein
MARPLYNVRIWNGLVIVLALVLSIAPFVDALKHGPAAIIAEAGHGVLHQTLQNGPDLSPTHDHHSGSDHDHVPSVILPQSKQPPSWLQARHIGADGQLCALIMAAALRRPPRADGIA